jgi:gliding motility-associated lipoprotein GldH
MNKLSVSFFLVILAGILGCSRAKDHTVYRKFEDRSWKRFSVLQFEIPVEQKTGYYDVFLFARFTKEYEYDELDFNMTMTTPSGEERIKEYHMNVKGKDGGFITPFSGDSCEITLPLKKGIQFTKGTLTLQIENLIPRLETRALLGVGIRLHPLK